MEVGPDIDELLDQLEASELLNKNNAVDNYQHNIKKTSEDITSSLSSLPESCYATATSSTSDNGNNDIDPVIAISSTAKIPQFPGHEDSAALDTVNVLNSSVDSAVTAAVQDPFVNNTEYSGKNLEAAEEFTTTLIDLESVDTATYGTKVTAKDEIDDASNSAQCANSTTLAELEEIFFNVKNESCSKKKGKQAELTTHSQLFPASSGEKGAPDLEPLPRSPTEADFAEMESYLARCLELCCKTKVGEAGEDSNTKNMKVDSDSASESKIQESLPVAVVECNNSIDDSRSISEADDTLLSACEEHEGLSDAVGGFEPSSIKEGGEALEQVRSVQSNDNFKDANNLVQGECSIVDAANTLDESVCDVIMAIEEKLEAVEIKTCSDNSSRSSSYNRVTEVVDGHDFTTDEQGRSMDDAVDELNVKPDLSMNNEESRVCVSSTNMNVENIDDSVFTVEDVSGNFLIHNEDETECSIHEGLSEVNAEEAQELCADSVVEEANESALEVAEESPEVSVVASTYDISAECSNTQLTESELQLGKVKPDWIADAEMTACMLCCAKFTFLLRRHHCRSCGRLLCSQCTSYRAFLPYMNEPTKKFKVCGPCSQTLERIRKYEEENNGKQSSNDETSADNDTPNSMKNSENCQRATKSVLKVKTVNSEDDHTALSSSTEVEKRFVKFRDGVSPGSVDADCTGTSTSSTYLIKPKKMRTSVSKRLKDLRMEEEKVCFLPDSLDDCSLYYRTLNGTIHKYDDIATVLDTFNSGQSLIITITRNLWCEIKLCQLSCCHLGKVVCVISSGMWSVGLDEIFIAYDFQETDSLSVLLEVVHRIYGIYKSALKNQEINLHNKMGLREAHIRMPNFYLSDQSVKGEFMDKDILLFRPSVQCFENLLVPEKPFFVGCFLHRVESVWALSIPQRLLYCIGLHASCYPTPVVNIRSRKPVYLNVTDTTVLRMFCDFKNWVYRLPLLHGSVISLCDNETRLLIPNFQKEEVKRLVNSNKSMFAWALSFNDLADSHLVCEQSDDAVYKTQVFTSGDSHRRVTGASFIVIDGALKGTDIPVNVNVVEDGIIVRLRPDTMTNVTDALSSGKDCKVELPSTIFVIEWKEIESTGYVGELVSPIDKMPLMGKYQYGLSEERIFNSLYLIPGVSEWALRLVSVFNCDDGKFPVALRSNVFAAAEQIAGQIPYTITPFVNSLTRRKLLELCIRIHITPEEAEYKAACWDGLESEFATWTELLDNQLVPGLFNVCSYISVGFTAEMRFALISTCSLP